MGARILRLPYVAGAAVMVFAVGQVAVDNSDSKIPRPAPSIVVAQGADRLPNETAVEWVTHADHVVVATVRTDKPQPLSSTDRERGEGIILRDLTLSVDEVLWSAIDPNQPTPDNFSWVAYGWMYKAGSKPEKTIMTGDDEPRLEVGHTYIMALDWQAAQCADGDRIPARWRGLGSLAILPYDDATIGQGEFEGQARQAPTQPGRNAADPNGRIADDLDGADGSDLRDLLTSTRPAADEPAAQSQRTCG